MPELRLVWIADIFDEVSGIITDTEEMNSMAKKNGLAWFPFTCYNKPIEPFSVTPPLFRIPTGHFYKGTNFFVPNFAKVIQFLREREANVIVSNTPGIMGVMAMASARYLKLPWVDIYHTDIEFYANTLGGFILDNPLIRPLFKRTALFYLKQYQKRANLLFVRTKEFHKWMISKGHPPNKLRYYPGGVNIKNFNPKNSDTSIWRKFNIPVGSFVTIFVGRITKVKDILYLLRAFGSKEFSQYHLVIIGDGPERESYESVYSHCSNIHFTGVCRGEVLRKMYASADLYVLPSASETLGKTVLEAMASGTATLVSNKGGPKDYVIDGENGRIFPAHDEEAFKKILFETLLDKERATLLGKAAREFTLDHNDEKMFQGFIKQISQLIK